MSNRRSIAGIAGAIALCTSIAVAPLPASAQLFGEYPDLLENDGGVFGPIPNLLDGSFSSPRGGSWSIRPFGRLGEGYRSGGRYSPPDRPARTTGLFGRIPRGYAREGFGEIPRDYAREGFGDIPNLLDWSGR